MPINSIHTIANQARLTAGTATTTVPQLHINEKVKSGQPCILEVSRDRDGTSGALDGTVAIFGADLPLPDYYKAGAAWVGVTADPGGGNAMIFDTDIDFVAWANYNWIVRVGDTLQPYVASPAAAGDFTVANNGGKCRVTIGTTTLRLGYGQRVTVYRVTPNQILADGPNAIFRNEIVGKTCYWQVGTHASNNLSRTVSTVAGRA
jgi:hypothetical protein